MVLASILCFNVPALALTLVALGPTHQAYRGRALTLVSHSYLLGAIAIVLIGATTTINGEPASFQFSNASLAASWYLWLCGVLVVAQLVAAYSAAVLVLNGESRPRTAAAVWPAPDVETPHTPAAAEAKEEFSWKCARYKPGVTVVVISPSVDLAIGYLEVDRTALPQMGGRRGVVSPEKAEVAEDLEAPSFAPRE